MNSFGWVCIKLLFLFIICNSVSARIFYRPDQSYFTQNEYSLTTEIDISNCDEDSDLILLQDIKIVPEFPTPGDRVSVTFEGQFIKNLDHGSRAKIVVEYYKRIMFLEEIELCGGTQREDEVLPPCISGRGRFYASKEFIIPSTSYPGIYFVGVQFLTADGKNIFCRRARVLLE